MTDYATVVLVHLGADGGVRTSPGIAAATGIPEPTVAKVLKSLTAAGLVLSLRGARGGYRLARRLDEVAVADVIAAIDGPILLTDCVENGPCESRCHCAMAGRWDPVNDAILGALAGISLARMAEMASRAPARVPAGVTE